MMGLICTSILPSICVSCFMHSPICAGTMVHIRHRTPPQLSSEIWNANILINFTEPFYYVA